MRLGGETVEMPYAFNHNSESPRTQQEHLPRHWFRLEGIVATGNDGELHLIRGPSSAIDQDFRDFRVVDPQRWIPGSRELKTRAP
jgi:hypothetical protein